MREYGVLVRRVFNVLKPFLLWLFSPGVFGASIIAASILIGSWKIAYEMPSSPSDRVYICTEGRSVDRCDVMNDLENAVRFGLDGLEGEVRRLN